jgi:uncharacterized delta-60 repeat protein
MKKSNLFTFSSFVKSLGLIVCLVLVNTATFAQDGANDPTFNPTDTGFSNGDGASSIILTSATQSDGKVIIGGLFNYFNGIEIKYIARLNTDGSLDETFNSNVDPFSIVHAIAIQSDGKIVIGGDFSSYNGLERNCIARLNNDGSLDETFNPGSGANASVNSISIQSDGKIMIGGNFSKYNEIARSRVARLNTDGSLDETFNIGTGINITVYTIAIQSDQKIVLGGYFTSYNGTTRNSIVRINSDGSLDETFNIGTGINIMVYTIAIQSDQKVVLGGYFTSYNGTARNNIVRINSDGSLDETFVSGSGANIDIKKILIQSNGQIIIGGHFTSYNGVAINRIARLNSDGSLDQTFNSGTGASNSVEAISIQSDGSYIIGGRFLSFNGSIRHYVALLNTDGSLKETSFYSGTGVNGSVLTTCIQPDEKIIIGGDFTSYNETAINNIARLNTDGSLDPTFNVGTGADNYVRTTAVQSDGKIIIGGNFTSYNGVAINRIARLNTNGTLDETFNVGMGANNTIYSAAIQSDGKIIIGGSFSSFDGISSIRYIARLNPDGTLDQNFNGTGLGNVYTIAIQNDGKIILGGIFAYINGVAINRIARLNTDGSLDPTFNVGTGVNNSVWAIAVQSDGKIIIGGAFTTYNGVAKNRIVRLYPDGSIDENFNTGVGLNSTLRKALLQNDGKIIIGGSFTSYNETERNRIARLNNNGTLDESFNSGTGADNDVYTTSFQSNGKIIIGGAFISYNGAGRNRIARILNSNGTSLPQTSENEVMVYPNPTEGKAFIDLGEHCQRANVEVFDIFGKRVMQKHYNETQILDIDITAPAGIYFITISTANKRKTLKLIKN